LKVGQFCCVLKNNSSDLSLFLDDFEQIFCLFSSFNKKHKTPDQKINVLRQFRNHFWNSTICCKIRPPPPCSLDEDFFWSKLVNFRILRQAMWARKSCCLDIFTKMAIFGHFFQIFFVKIWLLQRIMFFNKFYIIAAKSTWK